MTNVAEVEYVLVTEKGELKDSHGYNGSGTAKYPNGDSYEGMFVEGLRECESGKYTYATGAPKEGDEAPVAEVYQGAWKNNSKHGIGK